MGFMKKSDKTGINAKMIILDILSDYPETETIFKGYDQQLGECICCQMLFETVEHAANYYQLNLENLLQKLNSATKTPG